MATSGNDHPPGSQAPTRQPGEPRTAAGDATTARPASPATSPAVKPFVPGDVAAGRYLIVRFLARGAMGEVYEAHDTELDVGVAIKTLRPEIAPDAIALERFKREVYLARRVTHQNVCRIFDLEHHQPADGPEVVFLTMELLSGETLGEHVRRRGRLAEDEALPLARQMAAALDAAHRAGVVHRDFKSGNVVLAAGDEGPRAVVTDFGLARDQSCSGDASLTVAGTPLGTPSYMAPEQARGEVPSVASDVYAFGAVLYEMVTGRWPWAGETTVSVLLKLKAGERPTSPRTLVPELDPAWDAAVARCLEPAPEARFTSAGDVVRALAGTPPRRRGLAVVAGIVLAVLLTVAGLFGPWDEAPEDEPPARRAAAVLGFRNLSGDPGTAWLSDVFSELLGTELAAGEALRILPGEVVARVRAELGIASSDSLAADTLARLRDNVGADVVLLGSYLQVGEGDDAKLRLDLRVQDTAAGETVVRLSEEGAEDELLDLVARAGARLRERLEVAALSPAEVEVLGASRPANTEAARLYTSGLARLRLFDALAARNLLRQATAADPDFPLAHEALAQALAELGYAGEAAAVVSRAYALSRHLPREGRLKVEGHYHEAMRQWDEAISTYRRLRSLFPDDVEHGLRLAAAQTAAGRAKDALATVAELRRLPPPAGDDPRIALAAADAAAALSDFRSQLEAAGRAAAEGEARGASLLVARARLSEWWAYRNLGRLDEARKAADEAERLYAAAGDRGGVGRAENAVATTLADQGRLEEAEAADRASLAIFHEVGDRLRVSWALNNLARLSRLRGDLAGAEALYGEVLEIGREIDDKSGVARALANLGRLRLGDGDLAAARRMHEESLALRRQIGEERGVAGALLDLGVVLLRQGELEAAEGLCREAREGFEQLGDKQSQAHAASFLGEALFARGELDQALAFHREALTLREELGVRRAALASRVEIARVEVAAGRADLPADALRVLLDPARRDELGESLADAFEVYAWALLARGDVAGAVAAGADAAAARGSDGNLWERLEGRLAQAEIALAAGDPAAEAEVEDVLRRARQAGFGLLVRRAEAFLN